MTFGQFLHNTPWLTIAAIWIPLIILAIAVELLRGLFRSSNRSRSSGRRTTTSPKIHEKELKKMDKIYGTFTLSKIDKMRGTDFEKLVEKMFRVLYKDQILKTEPTPPSGDQGCDVVVRFKDGTLLGIQCKRYSEKVDNKAVQNIVTAKAMYGLTRTMVITNSYFTPGAVEAARSNRVELVDRDKLKEMLDLYNAKIKAIS